MSNLEFVMIRKDATFTGRQWLSVRASERMIGLYSVAK
jgi:hypothetical protein